MSDNQIKENKKLGYISLHRSILKWEWYDDLKTKVLFIHLLLEANYEDKKWRGELIERGQLITSLRKLSEDTGLTLQQVRTSITKLKSTHEITHKTTNKFSLIKIVNYSFYQDNKDKNNTQINTQNNKQLTNKQQTTNKQLTTNNNINKENKENNIDKEKNIKKRKFQKPTLQEVAKEISEKNYNFVNAEVFYLHYESVDWNVGKNKMKDWKKALQGWNTREKIKREENGNKNNEQQNGFKKFAEEINKAIGITVIDDITIEHREALIHFAMNYRDYDNWKKENSEKRDRMLELVRKKTGLEINSCPKWRNR